MLFLPKMDIFVLFLPFCNLDFTMGQEKGLFRKVEKRRGTLLKMPLFFNEFFHDVMPYFTLIFFPLRI